MLFVESNPSTRDHCFGQRATSLRDQTSSHFRVQISLAYQVW
jgi:hypothetical protein